MISIFVLSFEDMAFREVFDRANEQSLFNEEITGVFLDDTDEVGNEIGDETEFLDTIVPFPTDVDHSKCVGIFSTIQAVDHEVQSANRFPIVVPSTKYERSFSYTGVSSLSAWRIASLSCSDISSWSSCSFALVRTSLGVGDSSSDILYVSHGNGIWFTT